MSGLSAEDREELRDLVDDLPPDDDEPFLFAVVEEIVARHVEAFREQAAAGIESWQEMAIRAADRDEDPISAQVSRRRALAYHRAALVVRNLPR